jgi:hypothetical protein
MDLYFDKENIASFINNREHERYDDCFRVMQKQLNLYFNFDKIELLNDEALLAWFKFLTQGVGKQTKQFFSGNKFPERPLKSNTHTRLNPAQLSSIYLINDDRIEVCINAGALLIGKPGEEISTISSLFLNQDDYTFDKKFKIGGNELSQWADLKDYSFPISDIIVIDSYIACDTSLIDTNLIELISILSIKSRCKINIIVYTNHEQTNISYEELSSKIRKGIELVTGVSPNFTLIKYRNQRGVASFSEHDRTIFTNYNRMYSGDTFNYFLSDGTKTTKGRELHYSNYGKKENHELAQELINDIQNNISRMPKESIQGDMKSNFLNFS